MKTLKRNVTTAAAAVMLLALAITPVFAAPAEPGTDTSFRIEVIQTSDIHAYLTETTDQTGQTTALGMPKLKDLIDKTTSEADGSLVLDSGDVFHGQSIATMAEGTTAAELLGICGYDAMTSGNHDWNYGKEQLKVLEGIADANNGAKSFSILAGNVTDEDGSPFFDNEYLIKEVTKDGKTLKIGVFGVIDPKLYNATAPANVEGLTFTDMTVYSSQAAEYLRGQGCQIVIGIAHCIQPLAENGISNTVSGVDLWLDGHEHMTFDSWSQNDSVLTTEAGSHLNTVYNISIECTLADDGTLTGLAMTPNAVSAADAGSTYSADPFVQSVVDRILADQEEEKNRPVGNAPEALDGVWEHVRTGETTMGRAVTSAYLLETGADIAIENAGGIRAGIDAGEVTYGEALDVFPYGNYIVTRELTGEEVRGLLEASLKIQLDNMKADIAGDYDGWPANSGQALQVGGLTANYTFESDEPRITDIKVGDAALSDTDVYTVATNSYLVTDADNYPALAAKENLHEYSACEDALADYLSQDSSVTSADITASRMHYNKMEQAPLVLSGMKETAVLGDGGFQIRVSGGTTGGSVTYTSSNTDIATIDEEGNVTIKGAGKTEISAVMAGNLLYREVSVSRSFEVEEEAPPAKEPADPEDPADTKDPASSKAPKPKRTVTPTRRQSTGTRSRPVKTADETSSELYLALALAGAGGIGILLCKKRKQCS
ncbi:5'-nucleotidase C-terminal domain-containing protein [Ruminococcus sp. OA3]|uniref:5'-nucleotidase C-terminal domain-containing protein n=1 Tax=Ruminococcus sp. OA3 TaxID=2914164 RepID=UPI001F05287B|nr:5'-nucleotidase C-terminal domain-containing protein [Ruminococcus sp. OA3]MCH1983363.1 5'-nucleotidase C-terminal domain-containing protein [Ruminococcus sp. OA3]